MIGLVRLAANAVVLQRLVASTSLLLPASRCESFSLPAAPTSPRGPPRPHREVDPRVEPSRQRRRLRRWRRIPPSAAFAMPNDADGSPPPNDAMDYLRERARRQERQYAELFSAGLRRSEEGRPPESVHLLLFRPNTPVQSVHTIEYPMGSGDNWILAFEDGDDCEAFANDLRRDNLDFAVPSVSAERFWNDTCDTGGVEGTSPGRWCSRLVAIFYPSSFPPSLIPPAFSPFIYIHSRDVPISPKRQCSSPSPGIARCRPRASSSSQGGSG